LLHRPLTQPRGIRPCSVSLGWPRSCSATFGWNSGPGAAARPLLAATSAVEQPLPTEQGANDRNRPSNEPASNPRGARNYSTASNQGVYAATLVAKGVGASIRLTASRTLTFATPMSAMLST